MQKIISMLFFLLIQGFCFSQNETWIGFVDDTSQVKKEPDYYSMQVFEDTTAKEYFYKPKKTLPNTSKWIIYYDKNKLKKAGESFYKEKHIYRTQYYPSGQKKIEIINYDDSLTWAKFEMHRWYTTGKIKMERVIRSNNDTIIDNYYYPEGKLRQKDISVGIAAISSTRWCENGQLIYNWTAHQENKTESIHYHCNGKIKLRFYVMNGMATGKWEEWYDNGQKKTDGQYEEDVPSSTETGKWSYWDENGKPTKDVYYEHGKIIKEVTH